MIFLETQRLGFGRTTPEIRQLKALVTENKNCVRSRKSVHIVMARMVRSIARIKM